MWTNPIAAIEARASAANFRLPTGIEPLREFAAPMTRQSSSQYARREATSRQQWFSSWPSARAPCRRSANHYQYQRDVFGTARTDQCHSASCPSEPQTPARSSSRSLSQSEKMARAGTALRCHHLQQARTRLRGVPLPRAARSRSGRGAQRMCGARSTP